MSALDEIRVRPESGFVVARQDLDVTRNGIRSTVKAGSLRKADDDVVRAQPGFFYTPETHYCHVEVTEIADDGRQLGTNRLTYEIESAPPPADAILALRQVETYWQAELAKKGYVMTLQGQRTGRYDWVIRAELEVDAPPAAAQPAQAPPIVNVTVPPIEIPPAQVTVNIADEPMDATVAFKRDGSGKIKSATIAEAADGN